MPPPALALERIEKRYGSVHAVAGVSISFQAGALHAVVGENGAGKSTLLKIAAGVVHPDAGRVLVGGVPLARHDPREAIARGVGMVQQHFALVPAMSALDNAILGDEPVGSFGRVDRAAARRKAEAAARELGITLPWDAPVASLGIGDRQRLEIARVLMRGAQIVILDEPTAVLTPGEARVLYETLGQMVAAGRSVVVVTHHLDEVLAHAAVASVMRRGRLVSTRALDGARTDATLAALTRDIMGADPPPAAGRRRTAPGEVRLDLRDVRTATGLDGLSLSVRAGEVVGVAGVEGNGQRALARVIAGLERPLGGRVAACEVAVVHEDRHAEGLVLEATVRDNLVLGELARFTSRWGLVDRDAVDETAAARLARARVVPPDLDLRAGALSGGNQQKIVVERAASRCDRAGALVVAHPTRGVDLGAARAIHERIAGVADAGKAVLVISSDLGELRALSDRIVVLLRGRIVSELPPDASDAALGEAMLGAAGAGAA